MSTSVTITKPQSTIHMSETILAWHFRRLDGTTEHLQTPETVGQTYRFDRTIIPSVQGLHGSVRAIDALKYASGSLVCRTLHGGTIVPHDGDKIASSARKLLVQTDATNLLHEFACWCAERALQQEREAGREPDARSWAAIEAKRQWLRGDITDSELVAAAAAAAAAAGAEWSAAAAAARWARWAAATAAAVSAKGATAGAEWSAEHNVELERRLFALLAEQGYTE